MKHISFTFQIHQPYRLKDFHFFEIGSHHSYYDEEKNKTTLRQIAERSYLPANELLLDLINTYGDSIQINFAISGTALDQIEQYAPEVLESFKELAVTGNVEFLGQTYSTSLSSLKSKTIFNDEVSKHRDRIKKLFGKTPRIFLNTGLIYSDAIGEMISDLGFKATFIEGTPDVLKGKNPYSIYKSTSVPPLKLLVRNQSLSDDIAFRFSRQDWSEWPLTAATYLNWLKALDPEQQVVNLIMDYATFGEHHKEETGIFAFLKYLFQYIVDSKDLKLSTSSEIIKAFKKGSKLKVLEPVSWSGKEKDISTWQGNQMQQEALETLYKWEDKIKETKGIPLLRDWVYLQSADHFYYMNNSDEYFNPYKSPYEAFLQYMNVLSDFALRLESENNKISAKDTLKTI